MNEAWQFLDPMDTEIVLWRYIDSYKLESMMSDESLHFARAETFLDDSEGYDPQGDRILFPHPDPAKSSEDERVTVADLQKWTSKMLHVLCWNRQECESRRMWKSYLDRSNGVAIQTTVGRLWNSLRNPLNVGIGAVEYYGPDLQLFGTDAAVMKFFFKREKFKFENEVRAIWSDGIYHMRPGPDEFSEYVDSGVLLKVDLVVLIEKIVVNAKSDDDYFGEVRALATQHGLADRVESSSCLGW